MKVPPFATKLCVFSLLFYTALHVSAYKQAIFKCYLTILQKGQVTEFYSMDPLSHDIIIFNFLTFLAFFLAFWMYFIYFYSIFIHL
jgi:hypothetical protein